MSQQGIVIKYWALFCCKLRNRIIMSKSFLGRTPQYYLNWQPGDYIHVILISRLNYRFIFPVCIETTFQLPHIFRNTVNIIQHQNNSEMYCIHVKCRVSIYVIADQYTYQTGTHIQIQILSSKYCKHIIFRQVDFRM